MAPHLGGVIRSLRVGRKDHLPIELDGRGDSHPRLERDTRSVAELDATDRCLRDGSLWEAGGEASAPNAHTNAGGYFCRVSADIAFHRQSLAIGD
jgi:hypothetical protein